MCIHGDMPGLRTSKIASKSMAKSKLLDVALRYMAQTQHGFTKSALEPSVLFPSFISCHQRKGGPLVLKSNHQKCGLRWGAGRLTGSGKTVGIAHW